MRIWTVLTRRPKNLRKVNGKLPQWVLDRPIAYADWIMAEVYTGNGQVYVKLEGRKPIKRIFRSPSTPAPLRESDESERAVWYRIEERE